MYLRGAFFIFGSAVITKVCAFEFLLRKIRELVKSKAVRGTILCVVFLYHVELLLEDGSSQEVFLLGRVALSIASKVEVEELIDAFGVKLGSEETRGGNTCSTYSNHCEHSDVLSHSILIIMSRSFNNIIFIVVLYLGSIIFIIVVRTISKAHKYNQFKNMEVSPMFTDKLHKAKLEVQKTNDRLTKLKSHKKHMQMQLSILKQKDKTTASSSASLA